MATLAPITISSESWTPVSTTAFFMQNQTNFTIYFRYGESDPGEATLGTGHYIESGRPFNNHVEQKCWMKLHAHGSSATANIIITEV